MKKYSKFFSMLLVSLLILTGCGEKKNETPAQIFNKALKNDTEVNSLTCNVALELAMNVDGASVEMPISISLLAQKLGEENMKMAIHVSENPFMGETDLYMDKNSAGSTLYMSSSVLASILGMEEENSYWIKQEITSEDVTTDTEVVQKLQDVDFEKVITDSDLTEATDSTNELKHYVLNVTQDLMDRLATSLGEEPSEEKMEGTLKVDLYIDTKANQFTQISVDLGQFLQTLPTEELEGIDLSSITKLNFSIMLTDYNKTTVTIPEEVIKNAITSEEYGEIIAEQ